jgi:squalene-hopene/tetraprenyl-beta-curcumene cyclase
MSATPGMQCSIGERLQSAIEASQRHLLSRQHPDGYWWARLESNVTITAEVLLLHKIWGTEATLPSP